MRKAVSPLALALATFGTAAAANPMVCSVDATVERMPSGMGDERLAPAMERLSALFRSRHPAAAAPLLWSFRGDAPGAGALMFGTAEVVAMARPFTPAEIAPYEHQFHGDMMTAPFEVRIGSLATGAVSLAVDRRPGSPLPARITRLLDLALSDEGQAAIASAGVKPLDLALLATERARVGGFVAPLDPALPRYRPVARLAGAIRSVGSDGMKDLMDQWECRFHVIQPGVSRGELWEHLGTLNGLDALLDGVADIAPMGRELWPVERRAWTSVFGSAGPVEVAVARGGFDTPQRTTAQAIFVNPANPLTRITMVQIRKVMGADPTITTWGQLGLTGSWRDRPIHVRMPPRVAPNAMSMQMMALAGGAWSASAVEAPIAANASAILDDPEAISFGGLEEGAPGLKTLEVAHGDSADYVPLDASTAASGRYPLTRLMYIRLADGRPSAATIAFLRFILSKDGQERVRYSGYFPLSATEVELELAKLRRLDVAR